MNLSDDVLKFYRLNDDPFRLDIRKDADVFITRDYERISRLVVRAVERRDFAVVSGPTGAGKSQMTRRVLSELGRRKSLRFIHIMTPDVKKIKSTTLCDAIVKSLAPGSKVQIRTEQLARQVVTLLIDHQKQGLTPVVVIDDAHRCLVSTLSQLKRFWEFRSPDSYEPLLSIVLLGWPELSLTLANNIELLEVARRADVLELRGLNGEHGDYLAKKLKRVGLNGHAIFDTAAVKAFRNIPQAQWPLPTNRIASRAMRLAFEAAKTRPEKQRGIVTAADVLQAAEEVV